MTFNDFALFVSLVCIAGFFYLAINGVYQTTVQKKPVASLNPLSIDPPLDEQIQLHKLPKQMPRINQVHWHIRAFERPRKKGK